MEEQREDNQKMTEIAQSHQNFTGAAASQTTAYDSAIRKLYWRIMPLVFIGYVIAFIDRTNVGFAALEMNKDLGLSATQFALGAGLFFLSYVLLEIPSNLVLDKVGARFWIPRILITWGIVTVATGFIQGANSFYVMRFLLGIAEAGFFPGVLLYLTYWFPADHRAKTTAIFTMALPVSILLGGPIASAIFAIGPMLGLAAWRWLFILEGIPAILFGIYLWKTLVSKPQDAIWLTNEEKAALQARLQSEARSGDKRYSHTVGSSLSNPRILWLAVAHWFWAAGLYSASLWLPQIIKALGVSSVEVGLLTIVPSLLAVIAMYLWSKHSDRTKNRATHVVIANLVGAAGLFVSAVLAGHPAWAMVAITVSLVGIYCYSAVFYPLPQSVIRGVGAASGIAFISAFSNTAGFGATYIFGWLREQFGNFEYALMALGACLVVSAIMIGFIGHNKELEEPERAK